MQNNGWAQTWLNGDLGNTVWRIRDWSQKKSLPIKITSSNYGKQFHGSCPQESMTLDSTQIIKINITRKEYLKFQTGICWDFKIMIIGGIDLIGAKCQTYQFNSVKSINGKQEEKLLSSMVLEVESTKIILVLVNHSPIKKNKITLNYENKIGHLQKKWIKRWSIIQDFGSDHLQQIWANIIQTILKLKYGSRKVFSNILDQSCIWKKDSALTAAVLFHLKSILNTNTSLFWKPRQHLGKGFNGWVSAASSFSSKTLHSTSISTMSGSHGFITSLSNTTSLIFLRGLIGCVLMIKKRRKYL